jgi:DNA helicase-2/ATP-dependent DNA helicase PcrA
MTAFYAAPHRFSESLNVVQYQAVTHPGGPLLVSAGPGTGKTRVLTYRVAWLLDQGVPSSAILMLTFSCSAAREMLARAAALADRTKTKLQGGTFHSVACDCLRQHGWRIGLARNFSILDRPDSESIIGQLRVQHGAVKGLPGRGEILNLISAAASRMRSVEEQGVTPLVARIAADYAAFKAKNSLLDFDDLLLFFHRLLTESADAREKITSGLQHVLVDEYQDTNPIQAELVRLLAPHGNFTAVGDWAQAVYSFRGADADCIRRFPQDFPGCAEIELRHNYRSTPEIVAFSNAALPGRRLYTDSPSGPLPLIFSASHDEAEAFWVADKIAFLLADGLPAQDIAVLFRSEFHAAALELELARRGLAYSKRGGKGKILDSAHVKDTLAFFRILLNPYDRLAWTRIFLQLDHVGEKTASDLADLALSSDDPFTALQQVKPRPNWQDGWGVLTALLNSIRALSKPSEIAEQVIHYILPFYARRHPDDYEKRQRGLDRLAALLSSYIDIQRLVDDLACAQPEEEQEGGRVSLFTIHAAKCREWKAVFVIGLTHGLFPDCRVPASQMEEERRLFYVAVTRAMNQLFLSWPRRIMTADRRFMQAPMSLFLQDIKPALYQTPAPLPF